MNPILVKISSALITISLLSGCNQSTPNSQISEGYAVRGVELAAYSLLPSKGEFGEWAEAEISKDGTTINMDEIYKIGDNQWIEGFFAPISPNDKDTVFFSTQMRDATGADVLADGKMLNRILSYNVKSGESKELYKEETDRILRTLGIDGNKVIVMYDGVDNSPGPCFSVWADWKNHGYLDITNPQAGLKPYTVPEYKIQEAKTAQAECQKSL